jgi:hypothetical protein
LARPRSLFAPAFTFALTAPAAAPERRAVAYPAIETRGIYPPMEESRRRALGGECASSRLPSNFVGKCVGEEDLVDSEPVRLQKLDEVKALPDRWGIDSSTPDAPWKSDDPI